MEITDFNLKKSNRKMLFNYMIWIQGEKEAPACNNIIHIQHFEITLRNIG